MNKEGILGETLQKQKKLVIRKYEQFYVKKLDNPDKMHIFLERQKLPYKA